MNQSPSQSVPPANPFSTRFVEPGRIVFQFPNDESRERLWERWRQCGRRGQIVGPHGSGKSTLLHTLLSAEQSPSVYWTTLRSDMPTPKVADLIPSTDKDAIVVIDGYEQLGWATRWLVQARTRARGQGLLVTTHRDLGLPPLYETMPSLTTCQQLCQLLLRDSKLVITPEEIEQSFRDSQENTRETLFALYDVWELKNKTHLS